MDQITIELFNNLKNIFLIRHKTWHLVDNKSIDIDLHASVYFLAYKLAELYLDKEKRITPTFGLLREITFSSFCIAIKYTHNVDSAISDFVKLYNSQSDDFIEKSNIINREVDILNAVEYDLYNIVTVGDYLEIFSMAYGDRDTSQIVKIATCISTTVFAKFESNSCSSIPDNDGVAFCSFVLAICIVKVNVDIEWIKMEITRLVQIGDNFSCKGIMHRFRYREFFYCLLEKIERIQKEGVGFRSWWPNIKDKINKEIGSCILTDSGNSLSLDTLDESPLKHINTPNKTLDNHSNHDFKNCLGIDDIQGFEQPTNEEEVINSSQDLDVPNICDFEKITVDSEHKKKEDVSLEIKKVNDAGDDEDFNWTNAFNILLKVDVAKVRNILDGLMNNAMDDSFENNHTIFTKKTLEDMTDDRRIIDLLFTEIKKGNKRNIDSMSN